MYLTGDTTCFLEYHTPLCHQECPSLYKARRHLGTLQWDGWMGYTRPLFYISEEKTLWCQGQLLIYPLQLLSYFCFILFIFTELFLFIYYLYRLLFCFIFIHFQVLFIHLSIFTICTQRSLSVIN